MNTLSLINMHYFWILKNVFVIKVQLIVQLTSLYHKTIEKKQQPAESNRIQGALQIKKLFCFDEYIVLKGMEAMLLSQKTLNLKSIPQMIP